jgi:hypothetical protein
MLSQNLYTLSGSTATTVVAPTVDAGHYLLKNIQPVAEPMDYARNGYLYLYGDSFSVTAGGTVAFSFLTGDTGAQIEFYEILTTTSDVKAELVEGATVTTTGDPIPAYNINRNFSDAHAATLKAATAIAGGTVISREYLSGTNQAGSNQALDKIHTLEANTEYAFRFIGVGAQTTTVFFQIAWAEVYNGYNDIWLGTKDQSFVLRPAEEIQFKLFPSETINAIAGRDGAQLTVVRQD